MPYSILFRKWGEHMKQKNYMAGLYYRLSQEDERQGESVSIDNQRTMLRKYAEEHGFEIYGEYIDDGISGTTFDRPEVQQDPVLRPVLRQGEPALVKHGVVLLFVAADAAHSALIDEGNLDLHGKRLAGLIPPFL